MTPTPTPVPNWNLNHHPLEDHMANYKDYLDNIGMGIRNLRSK